MKVFLLLFAALLLFPAAASAEPGMLKMGTISCPGRTFDCEDLAAQEEDILAAANACINTFMGIKDDILDSFDATSDKHCARASRPYQDGTATIWATCCIKPIEDGDACKLSCTRYINK